MMEKMIFEVESTIGEVNLFEIFCCCCRGWKSHSKDNLSRFCLTERSAEAALGLWVPAGTLPSSQQQCRGSARSCAAARPSADVRTVELHLMCSQDSGILCEKGVLCGTPHSLCLVPFG